MKVPELLKSDRIWFVVVLMALGLAAATVWITIALAALEPTPLVWQGISTPVVSGQAVTVVAEVKRAPEGDCSNTFQMDMRDGGSITRLPVPTRTIEGRLSTYESVFAAPPSPGPHQMRLRENYFCDGVLKSIESPWIGFMVPPVSPTR